MEKILEWLKKYYGILIGIILLIVAICLNAGNRVSELDTEDLYEDVFAAAQVEEQTVIVAPVADVQLQM